tara:strand:+ start:35 stop:166 length:132 start_codon:yes stop_codon:yes gene_type:complete
MESPMSRAFGKSLPPKDTVRIRRREAQAAGVFIIETKTYKINF